MNHWRYDPAQAMVEFALVIAMLIFVLMGVFDLGRGVYSYSVVTNAAREGARYGILSPTDTAGIQAKATANAAALDPAQLASPVVDCSSDGTTFGGCTVNSTFIRVTVTYNFQPLTLYFAPLSLTGRSMMAIEP